MYQSRIPSPSEACGAEQVITLFRTWCGAVERGVNPLAAMSATLERLRPSLELAPACDSFFALTQACLGRPLLYAPANSPTRSADEKALLATLRQIQALMALGPNAAIPHGLPGALQWAGFAVLRALNEPAELELELEPEPVPAVCPFGPPAANSP